MHLTADRYIFLRSVLGNNSLKPSAGVKTTRELVAMTERVYNKREMEEQKEERRERERLRKEKNKTESRKGT